MAKKRPDSDRRGRQRDRLARILRVLQPVQRLSRWDTKGMVRELDCSERTIYRDLQVLQVAGVPLWYDEHARSYRVRPEFRFPVPNLTDEEILDQVVATAVSGAGARPTTRRLVAASREAARRILADAETLIVALDLKLVDHSRHQETIRTIQKALLQRRQLVGRYRSPYQAREAALRLHPYRLYLVHQARYLVARPGDRDRPQTYRVARFVALRRDERPALSPANFDLRAYFGDARGVYRGKRSHDVGIAFPPRRRPW